MKLLKILKKDLLILFRAKSSALIVILGPLLVIFVAGLAFDTYQTFGLNIGVYSESYNDITNNYVKTLQADFYQITKFDSREECINAIRTGQVHTCIIFPKDLSIQTNAIQEVEFYVDYSRVNLVWTILNTLSAQLRNQTSQLSLEITKNILDKVVITKQKLTQIQPSIKNINTKTNEINNKSASIKSIANTISTASFNKSLIESAKDELKQSTDIIKARAISIKDSASSANESSIGSDADVIEKLSSGNQTYENKSLISVESKLSKTIISIDGLGSELFSKKNQINTQSDAITTSGNAILTDLNSVQQNINLIFGELDSLRVTDPAKVVSPITTVIKPVSVERTQLNYIFPSLIVMVIMFVSMLLATTVIITEKESRAHFRNLITPTSKFLFFLSSYISVFILSLVQILIIGAITSLFFTKEIVSNLLPSLGVAVGISIIFIGIGLIIGYFFKSEETGLLAAISLGMAFLFLSNLIVPIENMPLLLRQISAYNPFVIGETLLRKVILFAPTFTELKSSLIIFGYYVGGIFITAFLSDKISAAISQKRTNIKRRRKEQNKLLKKK